MKSEDLREWVWLCRKAYLFSEVPPQGCPLDVAFASEFLARHATSEKCVMLTIFSFTVPRRVRICKRNWHTVAGKLVTSFPARPTAKLCLGCKSRNWQLKCSFFPKPALRHLKSETNFLWQSFRVIVLCSYGAKIIISWNCSQFFLLFIPSEITVFSLYWLPRDRSRTPIKVLLLSSESLYSSSNCWA